jgi:hypothetical protein
MYCKISEPLTVIGSALKEADVSKQQLKDMINKMKNNPSVMQDVGKAVSQGKTASDVEAGLLGKYGPIVALILGLAAAAHAEPEQIGRDLAKADTPAKVEQVMDSLLTKVSLPELSMKMKGKSDLSKVNQVLNDQAFHFDTRVGPTGQSC